MSDEQRKLQNGTQVSAPSIKQQGQWEDQKQRWEDENEIKNNDTWIKVEQQQYLWTACYAEKTPQDPIRPARFLNGVRLDDDEVANIKKAFDAT